MDPDADVEMKEDVEMTPAQSTEDPESAPSTSKTHLPRAMSVDLPDNAANGHSGAPKDKGRIHLSDMPNRCLLTKLLQIFLRFQSRSRRFRHFLRLSTTSPPKQALLRTLCRDRGWKRR